MIRHADPETELRNVGSEPSERRPIGQQNREVKQPERAPARGGHPGTRVQCDERTDAGSRRKRGRVAGSRERSKSEHVLVVLHGSLKVADQEVNVSDARSVGQSEPRRRDAVVPF